MVNNRKGGVGKTSLTEQIAAILASLGFNVAVADGDDQANATSLALPRRDFPATLTDVVVKGTPLIAAMRQVRRHLWIVPADEDFMFANIKSFMNLANYTASLSCRRPRQEKTCLHRRVGSRVAHTLYGLASSTLAFEGQSDSD
jgi:cellulose biosynthesis protein BcsQ